MTNIDSSGQTRTAGMGKPGQRSAEQLAAIERRLDRLERAKVSRAQGAYGSKSDTLSSNASGRTDIFDTQTVDVQDGQAIIVALQANILRTAPATYARIKIEATGPGSSVARVLMETTSTTSETRTSSPHLNAGIAYTTGAGGFVTIGPIMVDTAGAGQWSIVYRLYSDSVTANTATVARRISRVIVL